MKKHFMIVLCACTLLLALLAFTSVPSISLQASDGTTVDISYPKAARLNDDTITIYANYDSYGEDFEIIQDITVATDRNFTNILKQRSCTVEENGQYKYVFDTTKSVETVYIDAPVIYIPAEIETTTIALASSNVSTMSHSQSAPWFSVEDIIVTTVDAPTSQNMRSPQSAAKQELPAIKVKIEGNNGTTIPRLPKLNLNENSYGALSAITFDSNGNFESGTLTFIITDEINTAFISNANSGIIEVSRSMVKAEVDSSIYNGSGLSLVVIEE